MAAIVFLGQGMASLNTQTHDKTQSSDNTNTFEETLTDARQSVCEQTTPDGVATVNVGAAGPRAEIDASVTLNETSPIEDLEPVDALAWLNYQPVVLDDRIHDAMPVTDPALDGEYIADAAASTGNALPVEVSLPVDAQPAEPDRSLLPHMREAPVSYTPSAEAPVVSASQGVATAATLAQTPATANAKPEAGVSVTTVPTTEIAYSDAEMDNPSVKPEQIPRTLHTLLARQAVRSEGGDRATPALADTQLSFDTLRAGDHNFLRSLQAMSNPTQQGSALTFASPLERPWQAELDGLTGRGGNENTPAVNPPLATPSISQSTLPTAANHLQLSLPMQHPAWSQQLAERLVWSVQNNISRAELHLNPSELGPLSARIRIEDDKASLMFMSQFAGVRDAVESAMPKLRVLFEGNDVELGDVWVGSREEHAFSDTPGDAGESTRFNPWDWEQPGGETHRQPLMPNATDRLVDYYA